VTENPYLTFISKICDESELQVMNVIRHLKAWSMEHGAWSVEIIKTPLYLLSWVAFCQIHGKRYIGQAWQCSGRGKRALLYFLSGI
jgi:hypothetical protein